MAQLSEPSSLPTLTVAPTNILKLPPNFNSVYGQEVIQAMHGVSISHEQQVFHDQLIHFRNRGLGRWIYRLHEGTVHDVRQKRQNHQLQSCLRLQLDG